ncbi:MAG: hypothetical protein ACREMV_02890, partial [Gemmatimonadales bacterium]
ALLIPIIAVTGLFTVLLGLTPLGKAIGDRIRHGAVPPAARGGRDEVLEAVQELRREVAELAERVDFTERLVAKAQGARRLEQPR